MKLIPKSQKNSHNLTKCRVALNLIAIDHLDQLSDIHALTPGVNPR
jgi:hypothetical protein